jgi:hypothetical protein
MLWAIGYGKAKPHEFAAHRLAPIIKCFFSYNNTHIFSIVLIVACNLLGFYSLLPIAHSLYNSY